MTNSNDKRTVTDSIVIEWTVEEMTHWVGCGACDDAVRNAIALAKATGSTGATYTSAGNCAASVTREIEVDPFVGFPGNGGGR